jgi:hypothetical protein
MRRTWLCSASSAAAALPPPLRCSSSPPAAVRGSGTAKDTAFGWACICAGAEEPAGQRVRAAAAALCALSRRPSAALAAPCSGASRRAAPLQTHAKERLSWDQTKLSSKARRTAATHTAAAAGRRARRWACLQAATLAAVGLRAAGCAVLFPSRPEKVAVRAAQGRYAPAAQQRVRPGGAHALHRPGEPR